MSPVVKVTDLLASMRKLCTWSSSCSCRLASTSRTMGSADSHPQLSWRRLPRQGLQ